MIKTEKFGEALKELGYDFYSGVPCSWMKNLINYAQNECNYINAGNEGDALAVASGAYMAGAKSVVLMQSSGLGNAVSPLSSLNAIFKIPVLIFVSMREGSITTPQHGVMEQITADMINLMGMTYTVLSKDFDTAKKQIERADEEIEKHKLPHFILVQKDTFDNVELKEQMIESTSGRIYDYDAISLDLMKRYDILEEITKFDKDTIFIATTGKTGRELYDIEDKPNNFYMVGSMGCASSIGLGIALNTDKKVVVIDGDGAGIMRLSALPMIANYKPSNLLHIMINNNVHDSTGGQATLSPNMNWISIASSMGYCAAKAHSISELHSYLQKWHTDPFLLMIEIPTLPGSKDPLGRPEVTPEQVKKRFMNFLKK